MLPNILSRLNHRHVRLIMVVIALCSIGLVFHIKNQDSNKTAYSDWYELFINEDSNIRGIARLQYKNHISPWIDSLNKIDSVEFYSICDRLQKLNNSNPTFLDHEWYIFIDSVDSRMPIVASTETYASKSNDDIFGGKEVFDYGLEKTRFRYSPVDIIYPAPNEEGKSYRVAHIIQKSGLLIGAAVKTKPPFTSPIDPDVIIYSILSLTLIGLYALYDNFNAITKIKLAIQEVPIGVFLLDKDGKVEYMNEEAKHYYPRIKTKSKIVNSEYGNLQDSFYKCIKGKNVPAYTSHVEQNGERSDKETKLHLIRIFGSEYVAVFDTDVTEKIKQEKQITKQNKDLQFINSLLGHNLKNMVHPILESAEMNIEDNFDGYSSDNVKNEYRKLTAHCRLLYNTLDSVNRLNQNGYKEQILECIRLKENLNDIAENYQYIFDCQNIDFSNKVEHTHTATVSQTYLKHIFRNLIDNAITAMSNSEERGMILIESEQTNDNVKISITDTGGGVSSEVKDMLFKTNQVQDRPRIGLGSVLCKKMIEHIQGKIWIEKTDKNGTTICFTIPKCD